MALRHSHADWGRREHRPAKAVQACWRPIVIGYVLVHELAHLKEKNHTPAIWGLVERALPDYERTKQWLAERGGAMVVL
ncbi:MAG: M48 family metallopeptidase [Planctomycetota bacterium]